MMKTERQECRSLVEEAKKRQRQFGKLYIEGQGSSRGNDDCSALLSLKKDSIDQVNFNKVQKTQLDTNIHVEDMLFLYTNADSLPNKLHELKQLIVHLSLIHI